MILILLFSIGNLFCQNKVPPFKYKVIYEKVDEKDGYISTLKNDSIYVFFVGKYSNDSVQIYFDEKLIYDKKVMYNANYPMIHDFITVKDYEYKKLRIIFNSKNEVVVKMKKGFSSLQINHIINNKGEEMLYFTFTNLIPIFQ